MAVCLQRLLTNLYASLVRFSEVRIRIFQQRDRGLGAVEM